MTAPKGDAPYAGAEFERPTQEQAASEPSANGEQLAALFVRTADHETAYDDVAESAYDDGMETTQYETVQGVVVADEPIYDHEPIHSEQPPFEEAYDVGGYPPGSTLFNEGMKASLPEYIIESPDILTINLMKAIPRSPYRIESLDVLSVAVSGTMAEYPIASEYAVQPGGTLHLGGPYGAVRVGGLTLGEAKAAIQKHLEGSLQSPQVQTVTLAQFSIAQQIGGEHLVGPDGTVSMGSYGEVYVAGLTRRQAKFKVETFMSRYLESPQISLDVYAYNSKVYYVITQGSGAGDGVFRMPITGNETVLDAISQIEGLQPYSSKTIWIARPGENGCCGERLPVDWFGITQGAVTATNYQLLPGDRVFIAEDKWFEFDSFVSKVLSPFERMFGFTLLGTSAVSNLRFFHAGATRRAGF